MSPLRERLEHRDPERRLAAIRQAVDDPAAALLLEPLVEALGDPAKGVARGASDAVVTIHRRHGGAEQPLRKALTSQVAAARWGAAFTIARIEPPAPRLLPALVEALGGPDGDVRWAAARLLVETGRLHGEVLPLLVGLVRGDENPIVRRMATFALRELAPDRPESAQVLLDATRDDDLHVRRAAFTAMASLIEPPPAVGKRLVEALEEDADAASRRIAAIALGELAHADVEALPPGALERLRSLETGSDPDLRRAAQRTLERLAGRDE